ncbi:MULTISPECIES: J-domain-containing protein [unclassified Rathayibacter]|uniref:DnaJ family domain-containing protein n=1 Tax=unclassified Rathayibacter TaxID=2609250 RepID=UPI0007008F63|nr:MULTISPECIES: DUF1992 domain-containing protein [unclassified Rathayibacter]KQQ05675.1 molecular chaperone DnaJ [Rathayibacter sp. Leaf294]KQS13534.1 molecular chaperone DnaJ [Rathayibacter sp. Leaf185]
MSDAADRAARYSQGRGSGEDPGPTIPEDAQERAAFIETSIQQAIRRGDFDDLPGAGKPLEGLGQAHDPDWWIRRKIERENLTGLGPAAFLLRAEDRRLNDELDRLVRESEVRATLVDFNRRVVEARRQLLGGPPVVTPLRDVDAEVAAWADRRASRARPPEPPPARRRWWRRAQP